ncbi:hypothetical protein VTI28DRAFT_6823 [Corynascus sepedonium]
MATKDLKQTAPEEQQTDSSSKKRKSALTEIEVDLSLPEPPSKKARRLLKKGKALPAKPKSDDETDEDNETKDAKDTNNKKKKKERSPHGVWIGNLRFSVTKPELRKWLVDNSGGSITDDLITRVHMPTTKQPAGGPGPKKAPENRGFAYVDFATFDANVAAIALSETEWHGRKLLIKDSKSFEGRPKKEEDPAAAADGKLGKGAAASTATSHTGSTKIFVGNLSFNTTEDDLYAHFEKCGKIRWIKVATFEDSGKCKGYGWVNFEDAEAASWAVKGFVKVRETIETLEDFIDEDEKGLKNFADDEAKAKSESSDEKDSDSNSDSDSDSEDSEESDDESAKKKKNQKETEMKKPATKEPARVRTRKWWVNQLLGRNLKIELAEDDQTRYQKRFGKGAAKRQQQQQHHPDNRTGNRPRQGRRGGDGEQQEGGGGGNGGKGDDFKKEKKDINYQTDINVARLTGAPVAHQGKKVTFD